MTIKASLADDRDVKLPFPASIAIAVGDLLYWDNAAATVKKASQQADQLTEPANQRLFAALFVGVSRDQRLSTETAADDRVVGTDVIADCTCPSTAWEVGDLVGPSENAGGTALENQQVEKVTDPSLAIGYCVKREGSATTLVRARLIGNYLRSRVEQRLFSTLGGGLSTVTNVTDTVTITAAQLLTRILRGVPTAAATYTLPTAALLVAALPGAKVGDTFEFIITNDSGGANTITVAAGAGGTADGTLTVAQNVVRKFVVHLTNVTAAAEAYTVYGIG